MDAAPKMYKASKQSTGSVESCDASFFTKDEQLSRPKTKRAVTLPFGSVSTDIMGGNSTNSLGNPLRGTKVDIDTRDKWTSTAARLTGKRRGNWKIITRTFPLKVAQEANAYRPRKNRNK